MYEYLQSRWVDNEGSGGGRNETVTENKWKDTVTVQINKRRLGKNWKKW